ncbi:MAG: tetratricopeptide repeat protein [Acidobacteria bacterium]|nr:tetratricopeptide repeat protein [Acidobacteriota bacterium]
MPESITSKLLPAVIGALHQERAEGELVLEQNDGCRRLYWWGGDLIYLKSEVAGEQFGNYLLRQGVLDLPALQELLAPGEGPRFGEKVVQWGLLTVEERDNHLRSLMTQILLHALEHPVVTVKWDPCLIGDRLGADLYFTLQHRQLVWSCFQEMRNLAELSDHLYAQGSWRWKAPSDLLLTLHDLPLNPTIAYSLTFLGPEPIGFETFLGLTGIGEEETARLLLALWALGGLELIEGELPIHTRRQDGPAPLPPPSARPPSPLPIPPQPVRTEAPKAAPTPPRFAPPPPTRSPTPPPPPPPPAPSSAAPPEAPAPAPPVPGDAPPDAPISIELADDPAEQIDFAVSGVLPPPMDASGPEDEESLSPLRKARRLFKRAKIYIMQERASEAIRSLEQCLKLDPDSPQAYEAWLLLGKLRLGNPAWSTRAIEALQAAARLQPKAGEPWALMGDLYLRKGFKANAQGCYKKALELDPSVPLPADLDPEEAVGEIKEPTTLINRLGTGLKAMLGRGDRS